MGFTSGPVNPHGVTAITGGRRCALALWFTTEKHHKDMVRNYNAYLKSSVSISYNRCLCFKISLLFIQNELNDTVVMSIRLFQEREEAEALWAADGHSVVKEEKDDGESPSNSARRGRSQVREKSKDRERVTGRRDEL